MQESHSSTEGATLEGRFTPRRYTLYKGMVVIDLCLCTPHPLLIEVLQVLPELAKRLVSMRDLVLLNRIHLGIARYRNRVSATGN